MIDIRTNEVKVAITDLPDASPSDPLEALSWLGDTVEEIVEGLRARGIKGKQGSPWSCPLAHYLMDWWPTPAVGGDRLWTERGDYDSWISINGAPVQFEVDFDCGLFPDLIDNG